MHPLAGMLYRGVLGQKVLLVAHDSKPAGQLGNESEARGLANGLDNSIQGHLGIKL